MRALPPPPWEAAANAAINLGSNLLAVSVTLPKSNVARRMFAVMDMEEFSGGALFTVTELVGDGSAVYRVVR